MLDVIHSGIQQLILHFFSAFTKQWHFDDNRMMPPPTWSNPFFPLVYPFFFPGFPSHLGFLTESMEIFLFCFDIFFLVIIQVEAIVFHDCHVVLWSVSVVERTEQRMRGGKYEDKVVTPLLPKIHVHDIEKGGPKAPPRNKMALYEQLSLPSQKFNSGSSSLLSLTISKAGNLLASPSLSHVSILLLTVWFHM